MWNFTLGIVHDCSLLSLYNSVFTCIFFPSCDIGIRAGQFLACENSVSIMAEGTRAQEAKKFEDSLRTLKESSEIHTKEIGEIKNSLKDLGEIKELIEAMNAKYDQMAAHVYGKQQENSGGVPRFQRQEHNQSSRQNHQDQLGALGFQILGDIPARSGNHHSSFLYQKFAKIEFPRFYGENPSGWLYKCERFF